MTSSGSSCTSLSTSTVVNSSTADDYGLCRPIDWPLTLVPQTLDADDDYCDAHAGCWAACIAMLMQFRYQRVMSINEALPMMRATSAELAQILWRMDVGVNEYDKNEFVNALDLTWVGPSSITPQGWYELLSRHGPLWTSADNNSVVHARIMVGYHPNATRGTDPATGEICDAFWDDVLIFLDPMSDDKISMTFREWLDKWTRVVYRSDWNHLTQLAFNRCQDQCCLYCQQRPALERWTPFGHPSTPGSPADEPKEEGEGKDMDEAEKVDSF